MKEHIKDFFSFTNSERKGLIVLVIILIIIIILPTIIFKFKEKEEFDYSQFEKEIEDFQKSLVINNNNRNKNTSTNKNLSTYQKGNNKNKNKKTNKKTVKENITPTSYNQLSIKINSTDSIALRRIYGIGPVLSKRIIKFRNLLGGYYNKEQLLEVYGVSKDNFERIKEKILIDTINIRKINLNKAKFNQLKSHPYLTEYESKAIINYRLIKGKIESLDELTSNNIILERNLLKLKYYLEIN